MNTKTKFSFVSPCFNEEENLPALLDAIARSANEVGLVEYEILWIENGSTDRSFDLMRSLQKQEPRLRIIKLSRNFGYQGAIACGLAHACGEWVGILDADLQDHPSHLMAMWKKALAENLDIVYGIRTNRKEGPLLRLCYKLFYRLWRLTAEMRIPVDAGDFCVMRRPVVDVLNSMPERQRFLRGLRAWVGFKQAGFPYDRQARHQGRSKFNWRGMILLALDGLLSYSVVPLRFGIVLGLLLVLGTIFLALLQAALRVAVWLGFPEIEPILPPGLTQISLLIIGLSGLNLFIMGLVGEYVGRIYTEIKQRPVYVVDEICA